ncbi:MAG: YceI family protein [Pseudomonadota bacterium]
MPRWIATFLIAVLAASTAPSTSDAEPREWRIDQAQSALAIVYLIDGREQRGGFARYSGEARFDPDDLSTAELELTIETDSFDAGEAFANAVVRSVDWLHVDGHPQARYVLKSLEPLGGERYRATGELTMRGATGVVVGEMTLSISETAAQATGAVDFNRKEYGVGVGFTTLFVEVGAVVAVDFDLTAKPKE